MSENGQAPEGANLVMVTRPTLTRRIHSVYQANIAHDVRELLPDLGVEFTGETPLGLRFLIGPDPGQADQEVYVVPREVAEVLVHGLAAGLGLQVGPPDEAKKASVVPATAADVRRLGSGPSSE